MSFENPGAFKEAQNRIREKQEKEKIIVLESREDFEKWKEKVRKRKTLDVYELKRRIETGKSLSSLKNDIESALREGSISFETYQKTLRSLENKEQNTKEEYEIEMTQIPFSQNALAKYLEEKPFWQNAIVDVLGMMYGFFVQWSALLVILLWNLLLDLLKLPRDIYREYVKL